MSKVDFIYNREKDIWCLLNKGKSSNNSQTATKVYEELVSTCGENPNTVETSTFIDKYIKEKQIEVGTLSEEFEKDWNTVAKEYYKRAEDIFGVFLPEKVTAYLTINTRCPYSIENKYFFVSVSNVSARRTIMHELWHFYTWEKFGTDIEEKLGKQKYNDIKEALTVLLNVECADLLPEGVTDSGYPQHQEMRSKITEVWKETKDIEKVWAMAESL
jgi:hypothetical protein